MDNIEISSENGKIVTNDDFINKIIRSAEKEMGGTLTSAIPAITFDGEDPTEKFYIVLLDYYDELTARSWDIVQGRQKVYDELKFKIKEEIIDPNKSFIIGCDQELSNHLDIIPVTKPITVFRFMKVMLEEEKVLDDESDFDINEFDPCNSENGDKTIVEI